MGKINIYNPGSAGVNLVKNPLQLADNELTQGQNAELIPDADKGGEGSLSKRGGLAALTSALIGAVYGVSVLPLQTTYTRYLYVALQTADADRWLRSTDGTTFTATSSPLLAATETKQGVDVQAGGSRMASYGSRLFYPGDDFTIGTTAPPLESWDGTNAFTVARIPIGPSSDGTPCLRIMDMLVANGKVYLVVDDPPSAQTPNATGRVLSFNPTTGQMSQVATAFGASPFETAGHPVCLAFYNGQLWAGLDDRGSGAGKIVRCYPDVDESWTVDTAVLTGPVYALESFGGHLYASTWRNGSGVVNVYKRNAADGTYAVSYTRTGSTGTNFISGLTVFSSELYAVDYDSTGPIVHIKKFDGSSWSTDRDLDSSDSAVAGNYPETMLEFSSNLFVTVRATTVSATDGFVMKKASGTWSKVVAAENVGSFIGQLVVRS